MDRSQRWMGFIAYFLPVIGWIYLGFFQKKNQFARFHMRQAIGLCLFLLLVIVGWAVLVWLLAWIPYAIVIGIALFSMPVVAFVFCVIAWFIGMSNALRCQVAYLPMIGSYSNRLPI